MKRHAKEVIDATLKITAGIALPLGLASMITGFAVAITLAGGYIFSI